MVDATLKEKDYTTHNFLQWYVSEQYEEALARQIVDKLKLIGDDKSGLYFFDRDGSPAAGRKKEGGADKTIEVKPLVWERRHTASCSFFHQGIFRRKGLEFFLLVRSSLKVVAIVLDFRPGSIFFAFAVFAFLDKLVLRNTSFLSKTAWPPAGPWSLKILILYHP